MSQAKPKRSSFLEMAASSSTPPKEYDVFLSFRGKSEREDIRNDFVSHLYEALCQKGIVTYLDQYRLEYGQSLSPELIKSIEDSKFAIVVFSEDYASSTWCLNELVKIMECKTMGHLTVIPLFFVDPSDIRKQRNDFAKGFAQSEEKSKDNMEKVQTWKKALTDAANLKGEDMRRKDKASCIKKIVSDIFWKLPPKASAKGLVGIDSHMLKLDPLLSEEPNGVRFVGIYGMGGVGKTTIARAFFEKHFGEFEGACFLQDVSRKSDMVKYQKILLSKVLNLEVVVIDSEYDGRSRISRRLRFKKVLLVLDDVNDKKQLDSLAGDREWFGSGSRIIITTRDKHLLNKADKTYEVGLLPDHEAMSLFCKHAFQQTHPAENFVEYSNFIVSYARGLPLALKVLGSYLCGMEMDFWRDAINRLEGAPEDEIFEPLEISFKGLSDIQQKVFLDIACFFRGKRLDKVQRKLRSFDFYPEESITVLVQKSLVQILDGKIQMHDLVQEMGQHIVRRNANMEPRRYSRLWLLEDIMDVLTNNTGTEKIEGLVLGHEYSGDIKPRKGSFREMKMLRLLKINTDESEDPDYLPNSLRWLDWDSYPSESLPKTFRPKNLVCLKMHWSYIARTPDISDMPFLEILDLSECDNLREVHPSVAVHQKLVELKFSGCCKLKRLPDVFQTKSLEILKLSRCTELATFPEIHNSMNRLRILKLGGTKIRKLPWSVGYLTNLEKLHLGDHWDCLAALPSILLGLKILKIIPDKCSRIDYFYENGEGVH